MADPVHPGPPKTQWRQEELGATKGVEVPLQGLFDLSGQVAFVTGAARGVGAAIAGAFAQADAKVVLADVRGEKEMDPLLEGIRAAGGQALAVRCDVRDRAQVDAAVKQAVDQFGRLDCMVANAGILGTLCRAERVPEESWREVMGTNVEGAYNCAAAAYPHMKSAGRGKVWGCPLRAPCSALFPVACSSPPASLQTGPEQPPLPNPYPLSWAGHPDELHCGRARLRVVGQVNVLIPGAINTPFLDSVLNTPEKVNEILRRIPAGRLGVPEDMAGPALFLASRASDYVTGAEIVVDGGGIQMPMLGGQTPEEYQPREP